jgi:hypothetical protein
MKIASEIGSQQELNDLKSVMKVFMINTKVRQLAELSHIYNLSDYFEKASL